MARAQADAQPRAMGTFRSMSRIPARQWAGGARSGASTEGSNSGPPSSSAQSSNFLVQRPEKTVPRLLGGPSREVANDASPGRDGRVPQPIPPEGIRRRRWDAELLQCLLQQLVLVRGPGPRFVDERLRLAVLGVRRRTVGGRRVLLRFLCDGGVAGLLAQLPCRYCRHWRGRHLRRSFLLAARAHRSRSSTRRAPAEGVRASFGPSARLKMATTPPKSPGPGAARPKPYPALDYFAVYAPALGQTEETEAEQLLYFHPEDAYSEDDRIKKIGLAQGLVNFTRTFSPAKPCQNAHSQKARLTILEVEPGFWMLLRIKLGVASIQGKDGKDVMEYLDSRLSDSTCEEMLREAYRLFRLLNSTLTQLASASVRDLRSRLGAFFNSYVRRWQSPGGIPELALPRSWGGTEVLTLDKDSYSEVLSFVYGVEDWLSAAPGGEQPTATVLLWRSHVVWNGLRSLDDLAAVYDILTDPAVASAAPHGIKSRENRTCAIPGRALGFAPDGSAVYAGQQPEEEPRGVSLFSRRGAGPKLPFSGFLTGPANLSDPHAEISLQDVHISSSPDGGTEPHRFVAYQHMDDFTLLLFLPLPAARASELEFYHSLEAHIRPRLDALLPAVREEWKVRKRGSDFVEENYRFLYLNGATYAVRSSLGAGKSTRVGEDMLRALQDLRPTVRAGSDAVVRFAPAKGAEFWVVARCRDGKELYVLLPGTKGSTLADVDGEIAQLAASFFGDILGA